MNLNKSLTDQLMAGCALRYCLPRQSYVVPTCLDWLPQIWGQLTDHTKGIMVRDVVEYLQDHAGPDKRILGWDYVDQWRAWAQEAYATLTPEWQEWAKRDVAHRGDWPL